MEIRQGVHFDGSVIRAERCGSPGDDDVEHVEGHGEEGEKDPNVEEPFSVFPAVLQGFAEPTEGDDEACGEGRLSRIQIIM